jgi:hypothetical protein
MYLESQVCINISAIDRDGGFTNVLSRLALNIDSPNLCLPSNWDYRCEPWHLAWIIFKYLKVFNLTRHISFFFFLFSLHSPGWPGIYDPPAPKC